MTRPFTVATIVAVLAASTIGCSNDAPNSTAPPDTGVDAVSATDSASATDAGIDVPTSDTAATDTTASDTAATDSAIEAGTADTATTDAPMDASGLPFCVIGTSTIGNCILK
ncbi:MAG: hypothetical protein ACHREM_20315 [Polyangiales bacterium]